MKWEADWTEHVLTRTLTREAGGHEGAKGRDFPRGGLAIAFIYEHGITAIALWSVVSVSSD